MSARRDEKLVCFDAGGVLIRICRTWAEGCSAAGIERDPLPEDEASTRTRRTLTLAYQAGQIGCDIYFEAMSRATGGVCSPADVRVVHDAWLIEDYAGAAELLEELNATPGVRTAVLSNTNHRHWSRLHPGTSGVLPHFEAVSKARERHASHLFGRCKPDPAIFTMLERATGFGPDHIVYFDDLAENVEAARRAGWEAHQVDFTADPPGEARSALQRSRLLP